MLPSLCCNESVINLIYARRAPYYRTLCIQVGLGRELSVPGYPVVTRHAGRLPPV